MDGEGLLILTQRFPRYSIVVSTVTAHRPYGLITRVAGEVPGYIDRGYLSTVPLPESAWPRVGEQRRALVLGVTNDGRLRLDMRKDDLDLVDRAVDLPEVMSRWWAARHAEAGDEAALHRFYQCDDSALLLAWLMRGYGRGNPVKCVEVVIETAPEGIRRRVAEELARDDLSGDPGDATSLIPLR
ncbi:hypothetical protein AB0D49_29405 [Streptomyces sp. NPDC048290]|uniref:hypothetical protein n=1 Tax=Streptomyces sp. NPDC048290 TaxID=3155811 RepID=UPI0034237A98